MPWDYEYEAQNRANAKLMIGHPCARGPDEQALSILTGSSCGMRLSTNESSIWVSGRPVGEAQILDTVGEVPFDLDGCKRELRIFDIRIYDNGPRTRGNERAFGRLQLNSGYYLEGETVEAFKAAEGNTDENQVEVTAEEDQGTMAVNIRHKEEVHAWEVSPNDRVDKLTFSTTLDHCAMGQLVERCRKS